MKYKLRKEYTKNPIEGLLRAFGGETHIQKMEK